MISDLVEQLRRVNNLLIVISNTLIMMKCHIDPKYWNEIISSKQASDFLGMKRTAFSEAVHKGKIPYVPWGKQKRYTRRSLNNAIKEIIQYIDDDQEDKSDFGKS